MEGKGLRVNTDKTKIMISGLNMHSLRDSGNFPCGVCRTSVGNNSIFCGSCSHWIHKKCSGITGKLAPNINFKCKGCIGEARPIDARPFEKLQMDGEILEVVDSFCYLGDRLSAGGGCELSSITRIKSAWGKFPQLLPILTSRSGLVMCTEVKDGSISVWRWWKLVRSAEDDQRRRGRRRLPETDVCGT